MKYTIRLETPNDYDTTEEITREAFWNLYKPGCEEHFIAHNMRTHEDFIPQLSFVIEVDGKIVGSIFYSRAFIIDGDNNKYEVASFGPVSIHPAYHRQGLGRALITRSIEEAKKLGYNAIIIGGFPYHYQTYGFEGTKKYGITMPDKQFYTGIMALELREGALDNKQGVIHFSESLYVQEEDVEKFDKNFPTKKKKVLPCQEAFEKAASEIDNN